MWTRDGCCGYGNEEENSVVDVVLLKVNKLYYFRISIALMGDKKSDEIRKEFIDGGLVVSHSFSSLLSGLKLSMPAS